MQVMTIQEIRHSRFLTGWAEWREDRLNKRGDATDRAFAQALDISESYLNQLKSGKRGIGNQTARRIEKTIRKTRGWLDMLDNTMKPDENMLLSMYRSLSDAGKNEIAGYLNYILSREKAPAKGTINNPNEFYFPPK